MTPTNAVLMTNLGSYYLQFAVSTSPAGPWTNLVPTNSFFPEWVRAGGSMVLSCVDIKQYSATNNCYTLTNRNVGTEKITAFLNNTNNLWTYGCLLISTNIP